MLYIRSLELIHLIIETLHPLADIFPTLFPDSHQSALYFYQYFQIPCISEIIQYLSFYVLFISLSIMPSQRRQGNPLQYSCLENSMGRGAQQAAVHGVSKSWTRLSDFTLTFHFHFSLSCIGKGNGSPLQCSCLGNPRDGGAWWAAFYGVTQSRTRLK